jgi:hypothetical protein
MALVCLAGFIGAQTATTGQISGEVFDPSGAVVGGAKISLTGADGLRREAASSSIGHYAFPLLAPGIYQMEVRAPGFATEQVEKIAASVTETTTLDVHLHLANTPQTVTATAAPPLVQTESATTGSVVEERQLNQLPLPTRNFQQLMTLTAGTSGSIPNSSDLGRGDTSVYVNGQRSLSNNVTINGVDANSIGTGSTPNLAVPAIDSLEEFKVQTSLYDAQQGRNTGGAVAVVTKSGTNVFHGGLYEFLRNTDLDGNNFFLNREGVNRGTYDRNQYGGAVGGPVKKDRAWFFASYQGTRELNGTSMDNSLATVFLPANLGPQRDLASLTKFATAEGTGGYLAPTAQAILQAKLPNGQYLIPSAPGAITGVGSITPVPVSIPSNSTFHEEQFNTNLDLKLNDANRFYGKFFFSNSLTNQALYDSFGDGNAIQSPGWPVKQTSDNRLLSVGDTSILSSHLINDAKFGWNTILGPSVPSEPVTSASLGISNPLGNLFAGMPTLSFANMMDIGSSPLADNSAAVVTYHASDVMTWTHGRHTVKFGADYRRQEVDGFFNAWTRGQVYFLGLINGNPMTDFLSGLSSLSVMGSGDNSIHNRGNDYDFFAQDDFKVSSRLTLNLGLRYDYFGPFTQTEGHLVGFNPALATTVPITGGVAVTGGFVQAGNGNLPGIPKVGDGLVNPDRNNFGPRLGFAYKPFPSNRFVVRGGYGFYYDQMNSRLFNTQLFNQPYYMLATVFATPLNNPFVQVPQPSAFPLNFKDASIFPFGGPPAVLPAAVSGGVTIVPSTGTYPDLSDFRTPYVEQYNLGVQWEFAKNWLLDVGYVGSAGRKEPRLYSINQAPSPALGGLAGGPYFPGLSNLVAPGLGNFVMRTDSNSEYNSLQATLHKQFSQGLQLLGSYTWSHSIDDYSASDVSDVTVTPGNLVNEQNRGSSDFDRRQRLVVSGVYDLPKWYRGNSGFAKSVLNDWQVASIVTVQTGTPFSIVGSATAFAETRGDLAPGATIASSVLSGSVVSRLNEYFKTSAYVEPTAPGDFGTTGRNILRGPAQSDVDFSIIKFIPVREAVRLQFRTEFFNTFNVVNFANPVNVLSSANFGQIVASSTGPRVIQFALKLNF